MIRFWTLRGGHGDSLPLNNRTVIDRQHENEKSFFELINPLDIVVGGF
jgi:hypothetical protein